MYKITFYRDKAGKQPVKEYLIELPKRKDKDSKINFTKINDYIEALKLHGLQAP